MEKELDIYNKYEKCNIKAKMFYKDSINKSNNIFIFCHGFCSGKGSNSIKIVANMLLECGISSISFDFPGHIDSVQSTDKLKVDVCISYINSVVEYVKEKYGNDIKISFYAISFGAYILLNKLIGDNAYYDNIVLRSPAFNMKNILVESLLKEPFEQYKKIGKAKAGHGGKIEVPYSFYKDLESHNLYDTYKENRKILIIQGSLDDTAPIKDTYKFIENRPEIELIEINNIKHHMEPEEITISTEKMIESLKLKKIETYYQNTINAQPHKNVIEFINLGKEAGKAADLGCGAGRDTVYLIKNGWKVLAVDREDTRKMIMNKLDSKELDKFKFIQGRFENIEFENNNLVVANYSIPFCKKDKFNELWNKIVESIDKDGHFVGNFFGKNDEWNNGKSEIIFLDKEEVENLFTNFKILKFEEEEKDAKTGLGEMKHWHTYTVIARKLY